MLRWLINAMITSMIFFPAKAFDELPEHYHFHSEDVAVTTSDGRTLHGWYLQADNEKATILFFHGNAGNISHRLFKAHGWILRGFSVFLVDYRGYGKSEGKIVRGEDVIRDTEAAFRWLLETKKVPLERLILYGESLGTYPAVRLATEHKVAAIVLESPYTSFLALGKKHYGMIPGLNFLLKDFEFSNERLIADLKAPLFILHGTGDEICPFDMGREIFERAPDPKGFLGIAGGRHNNLPISAGPDYWDKPAAFIEQYL